MALNNVVSSSTTTEDSFSDFEIGKLDVFFFGFWFRWFFLRLSGILCGITSSLRIRKNFFDFSWFKLLRALFRFHIIYKKKEKKILSLVRLEHTTLWVRPYCSINWAIMSIDISYHFTLPFICNMKSKKCSKKFKSRKIEKILPYP